MFQLFRQKYWVKIFTIYLRYILGGTFVFASVVKIKGERFTHDFGGDQPINTAWHYFETMYQSGFYWQFIGWGQLVAGFLLMTQRLATLGAVMYFPIILNIFIVTVSYGFPGTPIITGLLLVSNIYLLFYDYEKLKPIVNNNANYVSEKINSNQKGESIFWQSLGLIMFVFSVLYVVFLDRDASIWFIVNALIGIIGFIVHKIKSKLS
ncbi:MAG: hypothetical protein V4667_03730 [Bacteroidota bacterium]